MERKTGFEPLPLPAGRRDPSRTFSFTQAPKSCRKIIVLSEKRDSNPRPPPWQGGALPTELFSQTKIVTQAPNQYSIA